MLNIYFQNVLQASALFIVLLPYILMTNFTATKSQISLQAVLLWLYTPLFVTVFHQLARYKVVSNFKNDLSFKLAMHYCGLSLAAVFMVLSYHSLTDLPYNFALSPYLWAAFIPVFMAYTLIDLYSAWRSHESRAQELEAARAQAAWQSLSAQIKPHFLFNTLNMIEHLLGSDPDLARKCLQNLAELYRSILKSSRQNLVKIEDEIATVKSYLSIQALRYGERFKFSVDLDPKLPDVLIPGSLILTLVENAIKHGVEPSASQAQVNLGLKSSPSGLDIEIENPTMRDRSV